MRPLPTARILAIAAIPFLAVHQAASPASAQTPEEQQDLIVELQQIQEQLAAIEVRAVQETPELQRRQEALEEEVLEAMVEADPETRQHLARLDALPAAVAAAEEDQDTAGMQRLLAEAQDIQRKLGEAQNVALAREDVAEKIAAFQEDVFRRMLEIEPGTEQLLARAQQLIARLQGQG